LVLNQRTRSPVRGGGYYKLPIERASDQINATLKIPRGLPRGGSFVLCLQYKNTKEGETGAKKQTLHGSPDTGFPLSGCEETGFLPNTAYAASR
jgi:hypothetical protein